MGKKFSAVSAAVAVAILSVTTSALAGDVEPVPVSDEWTITIAPYVWGAGLSGDVGLFGREPVNVDMSFSDIFKDLKFAAMGVTEAHNGTWGVFGDLMYVHTEANESIQRLVGGIPTALDASVDTESFTATLMGEFRAVDSDQMTFDLMAGRGFGVLTMAFRQDYRQVARNSLLSADRMGIPGSTR